MAQWLRFDELLNGDLMNMTSLRSGDQSAYRYVDWSLHKLYKNSSNRAHQVMNC
jgi:hypothetical protein